MHIRVLFRVAQNLIGEPARITFLRRGLVWQRIGKDPFPFFSSRSLLFPIFLSAVGVRFSGFGSGVLTSLFFLRHRYQGVVQSFLVGGSSNLF